MSTSAVLPVSSIDFGASSATASQQTVFSNLINQLQQAVGNGDLTTSATLLNAIDGLSPSSASGSSPLGTFLTSLGTALNDGSVSEAQSALTTFQTASPAAAPTTSAASTSTTAAEIAAGLVQSQIQLNLVTTLLNPSSNSTSSSNSSLSGLLNVLSEAYPDNSTSSSASSAGASSDGAASSSGTGATSSSTPYDTLVSSIQTSLAGGNGTITPALAYLQASGNFVNTTV
jgi:hypothetical protein